MRDITLKITGKQVYDTHEEDQMEFVTEGQLYERNNAIYMVYDESELSGMAGCKTTLKLAGDTLRMKRIGQAGAGTEMYFEENKRFSSTYNTPYGPMDLEILTRSVENNFDMASLSGRIAVCYDVSLQGMAEGKNKLEINVM